MLTCLNVDGADRNPSQNVAWRYGRSPQARHTSRRIKAEKPFVLQGGRKSRTEIRHGGYNNITDNNNTTIYSLQGVVTRRNSLQVHGSSLS